MVRNNNFMSWLEGHLRHLIEVLLDVLRAFLVRKILLLKRLLISSGRSQLRNSLPCLLRVDRIVILVTSSAHLCQVFLLGLSRCLFRDFYLQCLESFHHHSLFLLGLARYLGAMSASLRAWSVHEHLVRHS